MDIEKGTRVRLVRIWHDRTRTGGQDIRIEGTVAAYTDLGDGSGALELTDVPDHLRGCWRAPFSDADQTTTLDIL